MKRFWITAALLFCGSAQMAWATKTTATITGAEQASSGTFDTGSVTVTVSGHSETVTYGQFSTPASIASGMAAKFSLDCNSPVTAHANGATITFVTQDPLSTMTLSANVTWNSGAFAVASFAMSTPPPLTDTPTFRCVPSIVNAGENVTCELTLLAGATGTVALTDNGNQWTSSTPNPAGIAISNAAFSSPGQYTVAYNYPGDGTTPSAAGSTTVTVNASNSGLPGTNLYSFNITNFAANGNINTYTDQVNGTWSLGYDGLNRLTSATATINGAQRYGCWEYDSFGNMLTQGISNQTFSNGLACQPQSGSSTQQSSLGFNSANQITSGSWLDQSGNTHAANLGYDQAGRVSNDHLNNYLYDAEGKLCAVQNNNTFTGYLYDAEGHRVAKGTLPSLTCDLTNFQVTENYFIGPDGATLTTMSTAVGWKRTEVDAAGMHLATYSNDGIHYQITDWLGTRRMQVNPNVTVSNGIEESCTSWPFGDQLTCTTPLDASPKHFTGKERDAESGLDYFGARYYANSMGRFMSPDWDSDPYPIPYASLEDPQSHNLYSYVQNNPLSSGDPDGHASYQDCGNGQVCWQGDYNGERDCSGSGGCLFWNQGARNGIGEWQSNDPNPPPPGDPGGDAFTGLARMMVARNWGDFSYGARAIGIGFAGAFKNGPTPVGVIISVAMPLIPIRAKRPNLSGKKAASDIPSWGEGSGPQGTENGKQYASRMMNSRYGAGNWSTSSQEYSQFKKHGDRAFVPAERAPAPEAPEPPEPPAEGPIE